MSEGAPHEWNGILPWAFWHPGFVDEAVCENAGGATRIYYCLQIGSRPYFCTYQTPEPAVALWDQFLFSSCPSTFSSSFFVTEADGFGSPFIRPSEPQIAPFESYRNTVRDTRVETTGGRSQQLVRPVAGRREAQSQAWRNGKVNPNPNPNHAPKKMG
ncbi:hypothetical protein L209DRAFT_148911 [Thermothelomyces heterothallicus CBS 203.75]